MSAQNPAQPAQPTPIPAATEDEGGDETTALLLYVGGGALVLLAFLAFLCVGFYILGSVIAGHPMSDIFLTPAR
jgi:hypothetical protein